MTARGRNGGRLCWLVLLVIPLAASVGSCAVPQIPARMVFETPTDFVRLEPDPYAFHEVPETLHSQPAQISSAQLSRVLKGLFAREHRNVLQRLFSGDAPLEPVFRDEEIAWLAPRLSEALAAARVDERVTFYISYPQTSIKREIITGGLYVHEDRLHIMLGNFRIVYGIPAYGMVYDRRYPTLPTAPKAFDLFFEPAHAVVAQKASWWDYLTGRKKDELVIDLERLPFTKVTA